MWLAGGCVNGGQIHGETDDLGFREVVFERSTRKESLTDGQPAKIVNGILKNSVASSKEAV